MLAFCLIIASCSVNSPEPSVSTDTLPVISNPHAEEDFDGTVEALDVSEATSDDEAEILSAADAMRKSFSALAPSSLFRQTAQHIIFRPTEMTVTTD